MDMTLLLVVQVLQQSLLLVAVQEQGYLRVKVLTVVLVEGQEV
jgi:hypothetical protein